MNLFDPGSWGWGGDYPTGGSAQIYFKPQGAKQPAPQASVQPATASSKPIGPGLGYNNDYANFNSSGAFTGITTGSSPTGQVLGTDTTNPPTSSGPTYQDYLNGLFNQVNSTADSLMSGLDAQKSAQEQIANNNYTQGVSDINASQQQGLADLGVQEQKNASNKTRTLNDLVDNLRNQMNAGQVYLGARGAGDSSAANQYSYALTQLGNKSRGAVNSQYADIQSQVDANKAKLQQVATQELGRLNTEKNNAIQSIASWFADAQNQIRQTKGQNLLALGESALNQALSALQQVQQSFQNRQSMLQEWALNNAKTWDQAVQGMNAASAFQAPSIVNPGVNGGIGSVAPQAGGMFFPGANSKDKTYNPFTGRWE